ncbi:MAG: metal-dependent hydrolase [Saprospiraceae bacterium]
MTLPNHLLGGAVVTGVFGATISGLNLLASPWYLVVTLLAATLPDIDNTNSPIGRTAGPLSYWLNRRYGHRTITHSAFALVLLSLVFAFLETTLSPTHQVHLAYFFFWGYLSHILLDMCTVQGVKLFYPFHKSSCVIPGDPRYRFETGNLRHETAFFCIAALCCTLLLPLFKNGFWTSYNRLFGTIKHVSSEFSKANDMLAVEYWYRLGTEHRHGQGFCLEANHSRLLLLENGKFHLLNEAEIEVQRVLPTHTGHHFAYLDTAFVSLSADSLNQLLWGKKLIRIEIQSNVPFEATGGPLPETGRHFQADYLNTLQVRSMPDDPDGYGADGPSNISYQSSPRLHTLHRRIALLRYQYEDRMDAYRQAQSRIRDLRRQGEQIGTADISRYERIRREIQELEKVKAPDNPGGEIEILRAEISEIQAEDAHRYQEKSVEWAQKNRIKPLETPRFTGYFRYVTLSD